jgi:ribosome-associated translation inhibitor RaiA
MKFIIRNQASIANKYLRFAKWKIRKLSRKFGEVIYSEIYVKQVTNNPATYAVTVKMGVPGPDIVVSAQSSNLNMLWSELSQKMKRQLRGYNSRRNRNY